jgi:hypothetical protein
MFLFVQIITLLQLINFKLFSWQIEYEQNQLIRLGLDLKWKNCNFCHSIILTSFHKLIRLDSGHHASGSTVWVGFGIYQVDLRTSYKSPIKCTPQNCLIWHKVTSHSSKFIVCAYKISSKVWFVRNLC